MEHWPHISIIIKTKIRVGSYLKIERYILYLNFKNKNTLYFMFYQKIQNQDNCDF